MASIVGKAGLVLSGAALGIALYGAFCKYTIQAKPEECARALPGDEFIPKPVNSLTHAITVEAPARDVWPWLVQMGCGRGGWYSYDFLDNARRPSATRILPELQHLEVGAIVPAAPGATDAFTVLRIDAERDLVLSCILPGGERLMTWAFVLEPLSERRTRLLVRARTGMKYQFFGLPLWFTQIAGSFVHSIMQRKQLLGIAARARGS